MGGSIFSQTGGLRPGRSMFDLSYSKLFDCYAGRLIPVMCDEVVPGDYIRIGNECIVRMQPLLSPMLHEVDITVHYFFVPYRLLDDNWETFISGGVDGNDSSGLPRWVYGDVPDSLSLWDYFGFPLVQVAAETCPIAYPLRAYAFIWNEYYRDQTLQTAINYKSAEEEIATTDPLYRDWRKDYFTSALPWTQRGTAPSLPISGVAHAIYPIDNIGLDAPTSVIGAYFRTDTIDGKAHVNNSDGRSNLKNYLDQNTVDLASATTFNVKDLRMSIQVQKFMERNARAGVRYTEFLREHFGVYPTDERLQRPEYIGGTKQPLIVSEVLKTSQDGTKPQGNLAGHGLSAAQSDAASYHVKEYGLIMGLFCINPKPVYASQGINRQWLRQSKYDFYFPEFSHLSEQAIMREEIFASGSNTENTSIWGYQGRYDEMRVKQDMVAGNMRDSLSYWHMARKWSTAPALNNPFLRMQDSSLVQPFAVQTAPGYIVHFGNVIKAFRPIPSMSDPGLMDHF